MIPRLLFSMGIGVFVAFISILGVWRSTALMRRDLGILTPQIDDMVSDWKSKNIPLGQRVVTILLSDAGAAFDPFFLAPEPEGGFVEESGRWIGNNLLGTNAALQAPTALTRTYADSTQLIHWTHHGFSSVSEAAMSRELEKAILKAHDAGAEINIVAQGTAAGPVLAALKRVQGLESGGHKVGANKVILVGMSAARMKRIPSIGPDFRKPGNVLELVNIWTTREVGSHLQVQIFNEERSGETLDLESVWPGLSAGGDSVEKSVRLLREFTGRPEPVDRLIGLQEALLRDAQEKKAITAAAKETQIRPAATADTPKSARAESRPAYGRKTALPVATAAVAAPEKPRALKPGAPAPAIENTWPSASLMDFSRNTNGIETGWQFSAPADKLKVLASQNTKVYLPMNAASGLSDSQCLQYIEFRVIPLNKLGPGKREAEIQALFENETRIDPHPPCEKARKMNVHGHPADLLSTRQDIGGGGAKRESRVYVAIEAGPNLIYFFVSITTSKEAAEACGNLNRALYEGIPNTIRPKPE